MQASNKENQNVYLQKYDDLVNQIKELIKEIYSLENQKKDLETVIATRDFLFDARTRAITRCDTAYIKQLCEWIAIYNSSIYENSKLLNDIYSKLYAKNTTLRKTLSELKKVTDSKEYKDAIIDQYALAPDETSPNRENLIENSTVKKAQGMTYGPRKTNRPKTDIKKKQPKTTRYMPTYNIL